MSISFILCILAVTLFQDSVTTVILFGIVLGNYALSGDINAISVIPDLLITFAATALARKAGLKKSFTTCIAAALACMVGLGLIIGTTTPGAISLIFMKLYSLDKQAMVQVQETIQDKKDEIEREVKNAN